MTCQYCKVTGRIELFTSIEDCECKVKYQWYDDTRETNTWYYMPEWYQGEYFYKLSPEQKKQLVYFASISLSTDKVTVFQFVDECMDRELCKKDLYDFEGNIELAKGWAAAEVEIRKGT